MSSRETGSRRAAARPAVRLCALSALFSALLLAQPGSGAAALAARAAGEGADSGRLEALAQELSSTSRVSGTPAAARAAARIAELMRAAGLEVVVDEYRVFLPHARSVRVDRLEPEPRTLELDERGVTSDPGSRAWRYPAAAGYSAPGRVEASIIYANYGRAQDFAALAALNVGVRGKIVLIRYGGSFRGAKVQAAERAGAAAVLLYSDPQDDGFFRGQVYPHGPFRPESGVQRGSIRVGAPGDPATPGTPSPGPRAGRPAFADDSVMPSIPVVALGYGAAAELLRGLDGLEVPEGWQGGLPFRYHVTGAVRARVEVQLDDVPFKTVRNVIGTVTGATRPDEQVLIGAHYDSWTPGAIDNVSGVVALLEAARSVAARAARGDRPLRTIRFAAWDGEEWGLIGSTEWAEANLRELTDGGIAYVNLDGVAGGPFFAAMATPSLRRALFEATREVADPTLPSLTVYEGWRHRSGVADREPPVNLPSGGSDQTVFSAVVGMPVVGFGFGGASGVYHSAYDSAEFMRRFGDPGYRQHRAVADLTAALSWSLADAEVLPFDYRAHARELARGLDRVDAELERRRRGAADATAPAWQALVRFADAAGRLDAGLRQAMQRAARGAVGRSPAGANEHLIGVERRFLYPVPRPGRWWRNLAFAPHPVDAYASESLPGVLAALRGDDLRGLAIELEALRHALQQAAAELEAADSSLRTTPAGARVAD